MAKLGPENHRVHSFEADDLNFEHLRANISGMANHRIVLRNLAVSDHHGMATFTRNRDHGTNHLGAPSAADGDSEVVYEVPVDSLDNIADTSEIQTIDVLKIDVEGSDIKVLQGAEGLLSGGSIKAVIVEIPLTEDSRAEMTELFRNHGYSTALIVRNSASLIESTEVAYLNETRSPLNMLAANSEIAGLLGIPGS
jgi:FkbM family methyltransferase